MLTLLFNNQLLKTLDKKDTKKKQPELTDTGTEL